MELEPYERKNGKGVYNGMTVTVLAERIYLGATVYRDVLDGCDAIEYLTDAEAARVGFRPAEDRTNAYSVSDFSAHAKPVWDEMDMTIAESTRVPVDTDSEEFPTIDGSIWWVEGFEDGGERVRLVSIHDGSEARVEESTALPGVGDGS